MPKIRQIKLGSGALVPEEVLQIEVPPPPKPAQGRGIRLDYGVCYPAEFFPLFEMLQILFAKTEVLRRDQDCKNHEPHG